MARISNIFHREPLFPIFLEDLNLPINAQNFSSIKSSMKRLSAIEIFSLGASVNHFMDKPGVFGVTTPIPWIISFLINVSNLLRSLAP